MKHKVLLHLFTAIVLSFCSATISADVIEMKSGKTIEGTITEKNDQFIAIETSSGTSFINADEIKSIRETSLDAAKGTIVEVTGSVDVLPKGKDQWTPMQKDMVLNEGDTVRTGADSKATVIFADQLIMAIEPESKMDLDKLQKSEKKDVVIKVNLSRGRIWNDVGRLKTKQSNFYVATPQAVTGVRGTAFMVQAGADEKTTVAVMKGGVEVRTRDMMISPVHVKKRQMTEVVPNKPPSKPVVISGSILALWAVYEAQFGALQSGMGASSAAQTTAAGAGVAAGVAVVAVAAAPSAGSSGPDTVTVTASESGNFSFIPIDRDIDGSIDIGSHTVTSVDVELSCNPLTLADRFQIIYMGNVIGDTGLISAGTLLAASAAGSDPIVTIRVYADDLGTDWHWDATVTYHIE